MTAREHCAARRACPFGTYRRAKEEPEWKKLGRGYIGVTDDSERGYVAPSLIFAVEVHNGKPAIYSYTRNDLKGLAGLKPYSLNTLYHIMGNSEIWTGKEITFDEMISSVTKLFPDIKIPTPFQFWAEYGMKYDSYTGEVTNFIGAEDDK